MTEIGARLAALERELEAVRAREAIRQQLSRYARGQDWLDESLMDEVFWDDAEIDFGFFKGAWRDYKPVLMEMERRAEATFHILATEQIELDGPDLAHVECYGVAGGPRGPGGAQLFGGRYFHRFERRGGAWKSARCACVLDWTLRGVEAEAPGGALTGVNRVGARSPAHPWFRRMGLDATN